MRLVILVGLPGSGKTAWLRERNLPALSSDAVRELLAGDESNQEINRLVFRTLRALAAARAAAGADVTYVDATALTLWERRCWIRFAELHSCEVEALWFDTTVEECRRRNALRERVVPDDVLDRMAARFVPPRAEEGFTKVVKV